MKFSIVIPVYNCPSLLEELYKRLHKTLTGITEDYEIIMVNDGCTKSSWSVIKKLNTLNHKVKGINLSRNFGQHYAITAGLDYAQGDWIIVMDCDLQDKPEEITKLYNKAIKGYDIVFGRRSDRQDNFFKKFSSKIFYKVYNYFTENTFDSTIANFSIISKKVLKAHSRLREQNRSYYLFLNWLGFKKAYINVDHAKRPEGKSSYTISKLFDLALDSILAHSNKPLKLLIKIGLTFSFFSFSYGMWLIIKYLIYSVPVTGWTSMMVSLYFLSGIILINLGILGIYIGKVFNETKQRPIYIISETTFDE